MSLSDRSLTAGSWFCPSKEEDRFSPIAPSEQSNLLDSHNKPDWDSLDISAFKERRPFYHQIFYFYAHLFYNEEEK